MTINFAADAVAAASNPEEAALVFKDTLTRGLAELVAKALSNALATAPFDTNPALAGWESFVEGVHFDLAWAKPAIAGTRSLTQVTAFSPIVSPAAAAGGASLLGFEVGVSVKGTF